MMWTGATAAEDLIRTRRLLHGDEDAVFLTTAREHPAEKTEDLLLTAAKRAAFAGIAPEDARKLRRRAFTAAFVIAVIALASGRLYVFLLMALPFKLVDLKLARKSQKRAERFEADYPAFLLSLSSAVRTGQDPLAALCSLHELFDKKSELYSEVQKTKLHIDRGLPEEEALERFAVSIEHPDISLFKSGFILSRKHGSSLSPCLQRLVKVTRQRQSFRRKIATAVAMQKLSAIGIACCAIAIGCIQAMSNPQGFMQALHHPIGAKALAGGVLLMGAGLFWMFRLTKRRI